MFTPVAAASSRTPGSRSPAVSSPPRIRARNAHASWTPTGISLSRVSAISTDEQYQCIITVSVLACWHSDYVRGRPLLPADQDPPRGGRRHDDPHGQDHRVLGAPAVSLRRR